MKESSSYITPLASLVSYVELTEGSTLSHVVYDIKINTMALSLMQACVLSHVLLRY